jgi:hypothetical protein
MKKIFLLSLLTLFLWGCATYKFHKGEAPHEQGYVVSRDNRAILEYTVGRDNSLPDLSSARERFRRRRSSVEYYYKKMGYLQSRFRQFFWDPPSTFLNFLTGFFRLPFIASRDYKYEHNPEYREKIDKLDEEKEAKEAVRLKALKEELSVYIEKDLVKEGLVPTLTKKKVAKKVIPPSGKRARKVTEQLEKLSALPRQQEQEMVLKRAEEKIQQTSSTGTIAIITARPLKGFSPLKVHFFGGRSHSSYGKITSYEWDFGDGDLSSRKNPINTYFSTTYGSKDFTATLTVKDEKGNTATSSVVVEVMTR